LLRLCDSTDRRLANFAIGEVAALMKERVLSATFISLNRSCTSAKRYVLTALIFTRVQVSINQK
jgi:hypothetical protein